MKNDQAKNTQIDRYGTIVHSTKGIERSQSNTPRAIAPRALVKLLARS